MRKLVFVLTALLVLVGICALIYTIYVPSSEGRRPIYMIPPDAVYVIETEDPVENWEDISNSNVWQHLRKNHSFASFTAGVNSLDSLSRENKTLFRLVGSRPLMVSAHMYKRTDYEFLFVVDLLQASKLTQLKNYLFGFLQEDFKVTQRPYHGREIIEVYDKAEKTTLYLFFVDNLMVLSYQPSLVEASIDQADEPVIGRDIDYLEIKSEIGDQGMFRVYFQYGYLDDYMMTYLQQNNEYIRSISEDLSFSGFMFSLQDEMLELKGFTNLNSERRSYADVLLSAGKGAVHIPEIAPMRTAFYMGLGFDSFSKFYEQLEAWKKEDPDRFIEYQQGIDKLERFLKISVKENFVDWVDDEIAFLQMQPQGLGRANEYAVVLKAHDGQEAQDQLDFILKQVKKKTPVKFKQVSYKGYPINFMSIKGFFKLLLGKFFEGLDKPYFTIVEDYVIFSNHPQTLKNIINDFSEDNTLAYSLDFEKFRDQFEDESSIFNYLNIPLFYDGMKGFMNTQAWSDLQQNKDYIFCFPQVGFQLIPDDGIFESRLILQYLDTEEVDKRMQFAHNPGERQFGPPTAGGVLANKELLALVEPADLIRVEEISPDDLNAKLYTEKYETGEIRVEVPLKDGKKHGTYREFYLSGSIKLKGKYRKGKQVGTWKAYDEEGQLIEKRSF